MGHYLFGTIDGTFDEGSLNSNYIPPSTANFHSIGPNPGIIRLIVAYLKDTIGRVDGFENAILTLKNSQSVSILNLAVDDISLINLKRITYI